MSLTSAASFLHSVCTPHGTVHVATCRQVEQLDACGTALTHCRKDYRYYAIVEDTILQGFEHGYFVIETADGQFTAVQPFFVHPQDLLGAGGGFAGKVAAAIRKVFPRFLTMRTLMIGCVAGEGHLDQKDAEHGRQIIAAMIEALKVIVPRLRASLIVFKEFSFEYRAAMRALAAAGFARVPSLPSTRLCIDFASFDELLEKGLSKSARRDLRRKYKKSADAKIEMQVVSDIEPCLAEVYPLYLQVFERSSLQFEKLTPEFFLRIGKEMPDAARFFVWRQNGKAIAFNFCLLEGDQLWDEYLGLDYSVALDLHLYFLTMRDVICWAMEHGCKWYCSGGQGFEPKLHLRCKLMPLDLYVKHRSRLVNAIMRHVLPMLEPTRRDKVIQRFANYHEVWGETGNNMTQAAVARPIFKSAWIFNPYLQLFVGGIFDATGELLLKHGADAAERLVQASQSATGFIGFLVHTPGISGLLSIWTWAGIIAYILGLLLWLSVLRTIPLNIAFPIVSVLHLAAPIGARYLLHEPVPGRRWLGIVLALAGIMLLLKPMVKAEERL